MCHSYVFENSHERVLAGIAREGIQGSGGNKGCLGRGVPLSPSNPKTKIDHFDKGPRFISSRTQN